MVFILLENECEWSENRRLGTVSVGRREGRVSKPSRYCLWNDGEVAGTQEKRSYSFLGWRLYHFAMLENTIAVRDNMEETAEVVAQSTRSLPAQEARDCLAKPVLEQ